MKKIIIGMIISLVSTTLYALEGPSINNKEWREKLALNIVKQNLDKIPIKESVEWYLRSFHPEIRFKNEFGKQEALEKMEIELKQQLKNIEPISNKTEFTDVMPSYSMSLGKYDFKNERFPILGQIDKNTLVYFSGRLPMFAERAIFLKFLNSDQTKNYIEMDRESAKKLAGKMNRHTFKAVYTYTIYDYELYKNRMNYRRYSNGISIMVYANIKTVRYYVTTSDGEELIAEYNYTPGRIKKEVKKKETSTISHGSWSFDGYPAGTKHQTFIHKHNKHVISPMSMFMVASVETEPQPKKTEDWTELYTKRIVDKERPAKIYFTFTAKPPHMLYKVNATWSFPAIGYGADEESKNAHFNLLAKALEKKYGEPTSKDKNRIEWKNDKYTIILVNEKGYNLSPGKDVTLAYVDLALKKQNEAYKKELQKKKISNKSIENAAAEI